MRACLAAVLGVLWVTACVAAIAGGVVWLSYSLRSF
jgi:hypothetical protein